jgi:hypothetical protein
MEANPAPTLYTLANRFSVITLVFRRFGLYRLRDFG